MRNMKKAKEISNKFQHLLSSHEDDLEKRLRKKVDFFFTPYEKKDDMGVPIAVNFEEDFEKTGNPYLSNFSENPKKNWKSISNVLLSSNSDDFKRLLKAVNGKLYLQLKELQELAKLEPTKNHKIEMNLGINLFKKALMTKISPCKNTNDQKTIKTDNLSQQVPNHRRHKKYRLKSIRTKRSSCDIIHPKYASSKGISLRKASDSIGIDRVLNKKYRRCSVDYPMHVPKLQHKVKKTHRLASALSHHRSGNTETTISDAYDRTRTGSCPLSKGKRNTGKNRFYKRINVIKKSLRTDVVFATIKNQIEQLEKRRMSC